MHNILKFNVNQLLTGFYIYWPQLMEIKSKIICKPPHGKHAIVQTDKASDWLIIQNTQKERSSGGKNDQF